MSINLNKLKTEIEAAAKDLATLEVATFTNNATTNLDLTQAVKNGENEYTTKDLFKVLREGMTRSDLVGYSRFEIEGDTINYLNSELGDGKKYLLENHNTLVEGAQRTRKDFFEFVRKTLTNI